MSLAPIFSARASKTLRSWSSLGPGTCLWWRMLALAPGLGWHLWTKRDKLAGRRLKRKRLERSSKIELASLRVCRRAARPVLAERRDEGQIALFRKKI